MCSRKVLTILLFGLLLVILPHYPSLELRGLLLHIPIQGQKAVYHGQDDTPTTSRSEKRRVIVHDCEPLTPDLHLVMQCQSADATWRPTRKTAIRGWNCMERIVQDDRGGIYRDTGRQWDDLPTELRSCVKSCVAVLGSRP